jgi:hypothetical protein
MEDKTMTNTMTTKTHTPGPLFTKHLLELKAAVDKVQPLADCRGNVEALHAIVCLDDALSAVTRDIAPFTTGAAIRDAGRELYEMVQRIVNGPADGITRAATALLAKIEE